MTDTQGRWFHRRGELAEGAWETVVDGRLPGWAHTGLRVARLAQGASLDLGGPGVERLIVPLAGSFTVAHSEPGGESGGEAGAAEAGAAEATAAGAAAAAATEHLVPTVTKLAGRRSVFDGPSDVLYLSAASSATIMANSEGESRVLVATSPTEQIHPSRYIAAAEVPVELRGSGVSSRQVHNFGTPAALDAARFIVCEVITPAENWSSYPPHKHDEHLPGHESRLEEIYYFETAPAAGAPPAASAEQAFGMFSTYSSPAGEIEIDAMVRTGDVALVPYGYHGPAVAAPGYDLYYLNVMAGPDPERVWRISDDPAHAWVRDTWEGQEFDQRLPFTR